MRLTIVAVGRLREAYWRAACDEYLKRLRPYATVRVTEVPDEDLGKGVERALAREAEAVMRALRDGAHVVALDVGGAPMSSEDLAAWVGEHLVRGRGSVAVVIGGSAGLAREVRERADELLSLSPMTLPRQLCRVVLLEQLYRAFKIMRGEPYHR